MNLHQVGADGLEGRPYSGEDKFDEDDMPIIHGELGNRSPIKGFLSLEFHDLPFRHDGTTQTLNDQCVHDVHHDRKSANNEGEPEGPDPVTSTANDRRGSNRSQKRSQTAYGELQANGDG